MLKVNQLRNQPKTAIVTVINEQDNLNITKEEYNKLVQIIQAIKWQ